MAPRDDDKVMAGMLRRNLARSSELGAAVGASDCPPADILAAYYEHSLGDNETTLYDLHFSNCPSCREQLAAMVRADVAPQTKSSWAWLWNPYLLAPAVAVLALAVFFGVHRSSQNASINLPSNAPLVAMSKAEQPSPQDGAEPKPTPPIDASGKSPSNQVQIAPSDSAERDSLAKAKQLGSVAPPVPPSAAVATAESTPLPNALSDKKVQDLPLNGRNIVQLQQSTDSMSKAQSAAPAQPNTQSAQAMITSASPMVPNQNAVASPQASAAPTPSARAGGGTASASAPSTTAETVNRAQTQAPAAMSRFAGIAKSPSPQVADEISTQKVFRTPNSNVLWRSAEGGFVERSPDGGATWQGQPLPGLSGEISAGSSPTPKICWLVGSGGTIFVTKDASNWKKIAPPVSADFVAVAANDASNAVVTAADGRKFQTADGGKHWKALQ